MTILNTATRLFITVTIFFLVSSFAQAQKGVKQHKVRDHIDLGGGQSVEILQMRGTGVNEEWYVQYYRANATESTPRWEYSESLRITEQRILDAKKQEKPENNIPEQKTNEKTTGKGIETAPVAGNNANCTFTPPSGEVTSADKFSVALAKRKIYDTYAKNMNGTGMAPLKVGVTFISFTTGTPYINTVSVVPGQGAARRYDGAPVNATLYPVFSKHITCEQYRDATNKTSVEGSYVCFKNKDGNWACPILGFPKTTPLKD
jgi:hypothetical protein